MRKKLSPILLLIFAAVFLAGCTGVGLSTSWPGVAAQDETVFTAYGQSVYAVSANNGSMLWRYPDKAGKAAYYAAPALTANGQLIVGNYSHELHIVDAKSGTGHLLFTAEGKWIAQPVIVEDIIYAANGDGFLYAIDISGNLVWKYETASTLWSEPIVLDGIVYQGGMDHNLYAVNAKSGTLLWKTDCGGAIIGSIAISDGKIYLGTAANEILAVTLTNGRIDWRSKAGNVVWSGPAIKDGVLYFGDLDGNFYALNDVDQKILWQYKADGGIIGTPLLTDTGIIFTSENGSLIQLDYAGKLIYNKILSEKLYGTPVISGTNILIGTTNKEKILMALDSNGSQVWVLPQPK